MALTIECLKPIFPKYEYKYTDRPKVACSTYLSDKNPFNLPPASEYKMESEQVPQCQRGLLTTKDVDWKGKSRGLFFHHPKGNVNVICTKLSEDCKGRVPVICRARTKTRCTQTRYRESSAQTRPYQPEIAGDKERYKHFEIYQISKLLDTCGPPGEYEVKVIERARRRLKYEKVLQMTLDDKEKYRAVREALEWEDWVAREEDIHGCQMLRMEIVERMFKEREGNLRMMSEKRIICSTERIQAKRLSQMKKINAEYGRGMRRLEAHQQNITRNYRKGNIIQDHIDPASDLHAPQMRFGVNPNRRHFIGFRKNFDERIDNLDKQKNENGMASLICPFSKLRSWAKPKERMKEVTQRFCSEENLKNLYVSLKGLRTASEGTKRIPKCLKRKARPVETDESIPLNDFIYVRDSDKQHTPLEEQVVQTDITEESPFTSDELTESLRQSRARELSSKADTELSDIVGEFEGTTLGNLLYFLNSELDRLRQQKQFQAIQMLAQKERWRREAFEAGLRQKENKFREDHEELFKASAEIHRDTATLFLESVLEEEFNFTAEAVATKKITKLAASLDKQDLESAIASQEKDKIVETITDYVKNQVFSLAEKRFAKTNEQRKTDAKLRAMEELLVTGVEESIAAKYKTDDSLAIVGEFLDDLITDSVHYDFDILSPCSSEEEFDIKLEVDEVITSLLELVIHRPGQTPIFNDIAAYETHLQGKREARAIIKKLIRRAIPEKPWKSQGERIIQQTLSETFNEAVYDVECLKMSRYVMADCKLQNIISDLYDRMTGYQKELVDSSSDSTLSACLKSIRSAIDIFVEHSDGSDVNSDILAVIEKVKKIDYIHITPGPVAIDRRHERYNIMENVAERFQSDNSISLDVLSAESRELQDDSSHEAKIATYTFDGTDVQMLQNYHQLARNERPSSSVINLSSSDSSLSYDRKWHT